MLVHGNEKRIAFFLRDGHIEDFFRQAASLDRGGGALLAAQSKSVLIGAGNMKFLGHNFAGFGHGIGAVLGLQGGIHKAPAECGVFEFQIARKRRIGFADDERCAGHAFDAARDQQIQFAALDATRGDGNCIHAGAAEAIDGGAGNFFGQAGEKHSHARDVAIVFAGLIGAAVDDVVERAPIHGRIAFDQLFDRKRGEIVGANARKGAAVTSEGRANGVTNVSDGHVLEFFPWLTVYRKRTAENQTVCAGRAV